MVAPPLTQLLHVYLIVYLVSALVIVLFKDNIIQELEQSETITDSDTVFILLVLFPIINSVAALIKIRESLDNLLLNISNRYLVYRVRQILKNYAKKVKDQDLKDEINKALKEDDK